MNGIALALVTASALLHVLWNAAVRQAEGGRRFVWWLTCGAAVAGLLAAGPTLTAPGLWRAWPWLALSVPLNALYFLALGRSYAAGELSWAYPLARGVAVALSAPLALLFFHQGMRPAAWWGLALVLGGLLLVQAPAPASPRGGAAAPRRPRVPDLLWPVCVGVLVTGYSLADSQAVRTAPPLAYAALEYLGSALLLAPTLRGAPAVRRPAIPLGAGAVSLVSYACLLEAYRLAPVAAALAVRQLAPALAPLVGALALHERIGARRAWGTVALVLGAILIAIGG
jgi:drug/metabolite transporter (DMT)-like permease